MTRRSASHEPQVVDPARRLGGDLHAPARHHRRERGPAVDPPGPRRQLHRPAMGGRRLRADAGRAGAAGRLAGRPARTPAAVHRRAGGLLGGVAAVRAGAGSDPAQPGARAPGRGRGGAVRRLPGPGRPGIPRRSPTRHGDGAVRRHHRRRRRDRSAGGWGAHRRARLGVDLLPQRPGRDCGTGGHPAEAAREPRPQRQPASTGPARRPSAARCSCWCWRWCAATPRAGAAA